MIELTGITLGWPGHHLTLVPVGWQFPEASDEWSRDAIETEVIVEADCFHGHFQVPIQARELVSLHELLVALDGAVGRPVKVEFSFLDAGIDLNFNLTKLGHLTIEITIFRGSGPSETRLILTIAADQTYLPVWLRALDNALAWFPPAVRYQPRANLLELWAVTDASGGP